MVRTSSLAFLSVIVLSACSPLGIATGIGASAGIAASQEGGLSAAVDDARIQIAINDLWFKYDVETFRKLDLTINQGRVLVTGVVQDPENRVEAVRLAWQPRGVKQVINEVRVAESAGILGYAKDTWITTRIRAALTFDREIESVNYSIDTVQGTVYLMGFAQNRQELNRVIEISRVVNGVNGVVSYVKFVGGPDEVPESGGVSDAGAYQSTYDDQLVYPDPLQTSYDQERLAPVDLQAQPRRLSAPDEFPADGHSVRIERMGDPIVIRDDPLRVSPPAPSAPIESEQILWNGQ